MPVMTEKRQAPEPDARPVTPRPRAGISIDPARLTWYREARGWSPRDLSREIARLGLIDEDTGQQITVSVDAIAKNEKGERKPLAATVRAYCAALSTKRRPVTPLHLLPGGKPLPVHAEAEERRMRLAHNRDLREFARQHGIRYRNPVSGRVYYSRPLRDAYAAAVTEADPGTVARLIQAARDAGEAVSRDSELLAS